jgi:hypothetical protein
MESAARADVPADANVQHAHAIVDALNLAAQKDADLEVAYAGVECRVNKTNNMTHYFLLHKYIIKNNYTIIRNEYIFIKKIWSNSCYYFSIHYDMQ